VGRINYETKEKQKGIKRKKGKTIKPGKMAIDMGEKKDG